MNNSCVQPARRMSKKHYNAPLLSMVTPLPRIRAGWKRLVLMHIVLLATVAVAMATTPPQAAFIG